jgi:DNA invertase Pin-like site-specific DNA recombinase
MKQHEKVAAIYCRTAYPDDFSIFEQRDRLTRLANAKGYDNIGYYQDNGYSGLNFERPAFLQMCEDIQAGNIQCILVFGISRIGRDFLSVSKWLAELWLTGIAVIALDEELTPYCILDIF